MLNYHRCLFSASCSIVQAMCPFLWRPGPRAQRGIYGVSWPQNPEGPGTLLLVIKESGLKDHIYYGFGALYPIRIRYLDPLGKSPLSTVGPV